MGNVFAEIIQVHNTIGTYKVSIAAALDHLWNVARNEKRAQSVFFILRN